MEKTYIQWNAVNWITITLMASFGALFVGLVLAGLNQYSLNGRGATDAG